MKSREQIIEALKEAGIDVLKGGLIGIAAIAVVQIFIWIAAGV